MTLIEITDDAALIADAQAKRAGLSVSAWLANAILIASQIPTSAESLDEGIDECGFYSPLRTVDA